MARQHSQGSPKYVANNIKTARVKEENKTGRKIMKLSIIIKGLKWLVNAEGQVKVANM
jgi:hypothetical protein